MLAREHRDHFLKEALRFWVAQSLSVLGLDLPPIAGLVDGDLMGPSGERHDPDKLFFLTNDHRLHFEFQTEAATTADLERFGHYDMLLSVRDHLPIHTVVLYGRGVASAPEVLDRLAVANRVTNLFLGTRDRDAVLDQLEAKVASGQALDRDDEVRLALVGFMGGSRSGVAQAIGRAALLAGHVNDPAARRLCRLAIYSFAYEVAGPAEAQQILEVMRVAGHMTLVDAIGAAYLQEGTEKGAAVAAAIVLEVLRRNWDVPADLAARIDAERSLTTLRRWGHLAVTAESLEAFRRGMADEA